METKAFSSEGQGLEMPNAQGFAAAAFELATDDISDVRQLGDAYYLIRVLEKIPPRPLALDDVKEDIIVSLTAEMQKKAAREKAQALLKKAEDAKACIDMFEFPNIPCVYPVTWVRANEAAAWERLVTLPLLEQSGTGGGASFESMAAADLEILLGEEELEMLAELEFYEWLDLEAPEESGSEGVDGVG